MILHSYTIPRDHNKHIRRWHWFSALQQQQQQQQQQQNQHEQTMATSRKTYCITQSDVYLISFRCDVLFGGLVLADTEILVVVESMSV